MDLISFYRTHFPTVYRYFYYKDVAHEDIEELTQECFLRFHRLHGRRELTADQAHGKLYEIVRRAYRDWYRRHRPALPDGFSEADDAALFGMQAAMLDNQTLRSRLAQAATKLSPTLREVVRLRFLEGLPRHEVAKKLSIKEGFVDIYQERAIRKLERSLGITFSALS